jgi:hypothetical protein
MFGWSGAGGSGQEGRGHGVFLVTIPPGAAARVTTGP